MSNNPYNANTPKGGKGDDVDAILEKMGVFEDTGAFDKKELDGWEIFRVCTNKGWKVSVWIFLLFCIIISSCVPSDNTPSTTTPSETTSSVSSKKGMGYFTSYKTGTRQEIGVKVASRKNAKGLTVYDANWVDGHKSAYIFYKSGAAEVISQNGDKSWDTTAGTFKKKGSGVLFTSKLGSITELPNLSPVKN